MRLALFEPPVQRQCGTCRYWDDQLLNNGACHFNPPPWPPTRFDHWCGRWKKVKKNG